MHKLVGRVRGHNEERGSKSCYYRNCNDDGVEEVTDNSKAHTQGSDNKGKFADLRQAETAVHGNVEVLPSRQHTACGEDKFTDDGNNYEHENGEPVL